MDLTQDPLLLTRDANDPTRMGKEEYLGPTRGSGRPPLNKMYTGMEQSVDLTAEDEKIRLDPSSPKLMREMTGVSSIMQNTRIHDRSSGDGMTMLE